MAQKIAYLIDYGNHSNSTIRLHRIYCRTLSSSHMSRWNNYHNFHDTWSTTWYRSEVFAMVHKNKHMQGDDSILNSIPIQFKSNLPRRSQTSCVRYHAGLARFAETFGRDPISWHELDCPRHLVSTFHLRRASLIPSPQPRLKYYPVAFQPMHTKSSHPRASVCIMYKVRATECLPA